MLNGQHMHNDQGVFRNGELEDIRKGMTLTDAPWKVYMRTIKEDKAS